MAAATQAAQMAGLAGDAESAREMLSNKQIKLLAAQDFGIVTPLAQVVSAPMWCFEVGDDSYRSYSPLGEGPPPALRFGSADATCIDRATNWCAQAAAAINPLLAAVPDPHSIMREALGSGDDCHAIAAAGNKRFIDALVGLDPAIAAGLAANPSFVLGIWMAWCAWHLHATRNPIAAIGGNGIEFGWRAHGENHWRVTPAASPVGKYFNPDLADQSLGAIGDSAVVDICGFGGQALQHAPLLREEWAAALPADAVSRRARIVDPESGCVDLDRVRRSATAPLIHLAILHRDGAAAPIGRGFYVPPVTLFQ